MMHIKYKLDKSSNHGIGLFAGQDIAKGAVIYTASPVLDLNITEEQFNLLSDNEKAEIEWWGFFDGPSHKWHVDFDVSKFINHSYDPSVTQSVHRDDAYLVAVRNIVNGEELTQNYLEFESREDLERRGISVNRKHEV